MIDPRIIFGRLGNTMFQGAYLFTQMKEGTIPDIYVQDYTLFSKYEKEIKEMYSQGIGYLPYVSIHVRRGANPLNKSEPKYSENPFYVNLSETDYYEKATELFPNDNFLVFSDDPEWCREKWGGNERFQIMDKGDELEDFNLMASCSKGAIIANSSYSWWAGFLNSNPDSRVVYPSQWFTDNINRVTFPKQWTRI